MEPFTSSTDTPDNNPRKISDFSAKKTESASDIKSDIESALENQNNLDGPPEDAPQKTENENLKDKNLKVDDPLIIAASSSEEGDSKIPRNAQNDQLLEQLKDTRDELRGTLEVTQSQKKSRKILKLLVTLAITSLVFIIIFFLMQKNPVSPVGEVNTPRQAFVLPADLNTKESEERDALQIISLARKNNPDTIINTWLDKTKLSQSEQGFKDLIASYANASDGSSSQLISKKVGKTNFGQTGNVPADAASLIYKSNYYSRANKIYTKINLYKPTATSDVWKLYLFEFKSAEDSKSPLEANLEV